MRKETQKELAAKAAALYVRDGMTLGLGTGSTAYYFIREAGAMAAKGFRFRAVVTSKKSRELALAFHIPVISPEETEFIDLAIDGVDEIDKDFCAVKGGGGALLREKIVASKAHEVIWIMDESKLVDRLGAFPLPVEVLPFGSRWTADAAKRLGGDVRLRCVEGRPYRTDNGNAILDMTFPQRTDYRTADRELRRIPGVLETGFFDAICSRIIVGGRDGVREILNPERVCTTAMDESF